METSGRCGHAPGGRNRNAGEVHRRGTGGCSRPADGHVALIPAGVPATVQAIVVAGNELQELPYGPGGHPDPLGASEEDCSSTVNYVLYRAGVRQIAEIVADNPLAQDYVHWGAPGPGRWVTIYATDEPTPHVFIVIAGLRLGHESQRHGCRAQPRRRRSALAHPRPHPHMGTLVGPPPTGVVDMAERRKPRSYGFNGSPADCPDGDREVDYLLIGGGLASANCARWLREEGAEGEVLLVGREPDPPYNRPDCSKGYLRGEESREEPLFRPSEWWGEQDIELLTRTSVTELDLEARTAKLSSKEEVEFGQALIATGANVRRLNVDGLRAGADPLPAHARQRRRDPRGRERRGGRGADRRLLHRLRGRGVADHDGQALHDRDAGAARRSSAGSGERRAASCRSCSKRTA